MHVNIAITSMFHFDVLPLLTQDHHLSGFHHTVWLHTWATDNCFAPSYPVQDFPCQLNVLFVQAKAGRKFRYTGKGTIEKLIVVYDRTSKTASGTGSWVFSQVAD